MRLKSILRQIQSDSVGLSTDASLKWCLTPPLWHIDAVGERLPHQSRPAAAVRKSLDMANRRRGTILRADVIGVEVATASRANYYAVLDELLIAA